jgi:hypothetical protein
MPKRHHAGPVRQRLLAVGVFAALLAQMALPALHALGTEGPAFRDAPWQLASASTPGAAWRAPQPAPAHDPSACPVCQSLLRTSPVATSPVAREESCAVRPAATPAVLACADFGEVMTGHPPRAPPAHAFRLV